LNRRASTRAHRGSRAGAWAVVASAVVFAVVFGGCASRPPPRACSTEAPPSPPKNGPIEFGMCPADAPDAGSNDPSAADALDATTDGG